MHTQPTHRLELFGSPTLATVDGTPLTGRVVQRHRLALLALLAQAPGTALSRDALMAHLWPESDLEQARNLLKVSVYVIRQALGDDAIQSVGDNLHLGTGAVEVDTIEFEAAAERGEDERAAGLYTAPFLDAFFLPDALEFEHWVDRERTRLSDEYAMVLERLARKAEAEGDLVGAVDRWKARAAHDPFDSRVALELMKAMAAAGSRAAALRHSATHTRLLEEEVGIAPSAEIVALAQRLRAESAPTAQGTSPAPRGTDPVGSSTSPDGMPSPHSAAPVHSQSARRRPRWVPVAVAVLAGVAATVLLRVVRPAVPEASTSAEDIAKAVVREMTSGTRASPIDLLDRPPTTNVGAWDLYRRASQPEVLRNDSTASEALALFGRAVDLDPSFAAAHAGLARLYVRIGPPDNRDMPRVDRFELARRHATQAIALDPSLPEAHGTLGISEMFLYHFGAAEEHLLRAVQLDPRNSRTREWLVQLYVWTGQFDQALLQAQRALVDDPLSPSARGELARALMVNGRCDEALDVLAPLADLNPPLLRAGTIAAHCLASRGRWDEALGELRKRLPAAGSLGQASLAFFLARAGRVDEATALLTELLERSRTSAGEAFGIATVYAGLGRLDQAFEWLHRSIDDHSFWYEIREPRFAVLHADPRYEELLARVGLE